MKGRIEFQPPGFISFPVDWEKFVNEPLNKGFFVEAFVQADAMVDAQLDNLLLLVYEDHRSRDLIKELKSISSIHFQGLTTASILLSKKIIDDNFRQRIMKFKTARNSVAHNEEGEYILVLFNQKTPYSNQQELDVCMEEEVKRWLIEARNIWDELVLKIESFSRSP